MRINYKLVNNEAVVTGIDNPGSMVLVPDELDGHIVTGIDKKAFLGIKGLRSIEISKNVTQIGDWAFAQCIHLKNVSWGKKVNLGRGVLEGCERLESVSFGEAKGAVLAAMTVHRLSAEYLLRDAEMGEENWYVKWDLALSNLLAQDDMEGYSNRALCGEEDVSYDGVGSVDGELPGENAAYIMEQKKNKCFLCLTRIMNDEYISEASRQSFIQYLKRHEKGAGNESAWLTVKEDFKDSIDYLKLFIDVTKPAAETIAAMIEDAGNLAEIKAYLINLSGGGSSVDDFFDDLEL